MFALADLAVSQEAIDNALWQYPVAALLLLVVGLFLRHLSKAEQRNQEDRRQIHESFATNLSDNRREMSQALDRLGERHQAITDTFNTTISESTSRQSDMQAQIIEFMAKMEARK